MTKRKIRKLLTAINQMAKFLLKNNYLTFITVTLSVIYFISIYTVCNYYYPTSTSEDVRGWWHMKTDSYLLLVCIWIFIASRPKQTDIKLARIQTIITAIGIGYGLSNFIDRRFIHDREFGWNDLLIIVVIVFVSQIKFKKILSRIKKNL